ncbi:MAG: MmgE/PrpD family protein, partial [Candidatus Micrarchaeaceae archaeon]
GFETVSRIGNATYPGHYDAGWHSTGTIGGFGTATAVGRLLGLSHAEMIWSIGLAATQAAGLRDMFGSMAKAFHAGRAAQNGYMAALLAQRGFTAGTQSIEGPRGFAAVQSPAYDLAKITARLGQEFDLRANSYKPFPCGLVVHPTIDACIQIRNEHNLDPRQVAAVRLRVAPIVNDLCGKKNITSELESKFSIYHAAAVGLTKGKAGPREFTDEAIKDPIVHRMRERIVVSADPSVPDESVYVEVELTDDRTLNKHLEHPIGSLKKPLSDRQLEDKFRNQAVSLPKLQADELVKACWHIDDLDNIEKLILLAVPNAR